MNIVVVGGNGLVGRNVVRRLRGKGHEVAAASRATGVDIVTGKGLAQVLEGAEVVVDVSNSPVLLTSTSLLGKAWRRCWRAPKSWST